MSQTWITIDAADTISDSRSDINTNFSTLKSHHSGSSYPSADLVVGMTCYRTDLNKMYVLSSTGPAVWDEVPKFSRFGTSSVVNTGTSGATVPLNNTANTFSAKLTLTNSEAVDVGGNKVMYSFGFQQDVGSYRVYNVNSGKGHDFQINGTSQFYVNTLGKAFALNSLSVTGTLSVNGSTIGSAAFLTAGTSANNVVQLTSAGKLPAVDGSLLTGLPSFGHGQCYLSRTSTTELKLSPENGIRIICDGAVKTLPIAGLTVSNSGLSANTLYYIYVKDTDSSGVLDELSCSTTAHSLDATTGVRRKSDDASKTLVGMVYINSSGQFHVAASYFNRKWQNTSYTLGGSSGVFSYSTTGALLSGVQTDFLAWGDEDVELSSVGGMILNATSLYTRLYLAVDGIGQLATVYGDPTRVIDRPIPFSQQLPYRTTEGRHTLDMGAYNVTTSSYYVGIYPGTSIYARFRG